MNGTVAVVKKGDDSNDDITTEKDHETMDALDALEDGNTSMSNVSSADDDNDATATNTTANGHNNNNGMNDDDNDDDDGNDNSISEASSTKANNEEDGKVIIINCGGKMARTQMEENHFTTHKKTLSAALPNTHTHTQRCKNAVCQNHKTRHQWWTSWQRSAVQRLIQTKVMEQHFHTLFSIGHDIQSRNGIISDFICDVFAVLCLCLWN